MPKLYFDLIEVLMMAISLYVAMWLTNFVPVAHYLSNDKIMWEVVSVLPGLLSALLFASIQQSSTILRCMIQLEPDLVEEIVDAAESSVRFSYFTLRYYDENFVL